MSSPPTAVAPVSIRRARPLLGTFVEIAVAGARPAAMEAAVEAAFDAIATVHRLMSFHEAGSDVSRLNRGAAARPVRVHDWTYEVLATAADLHARSSGAFDVCVAPALQQLGLLPPFPGTRSPYGGPTPSPGQNRPLPAFNPHEPKPDTPLFGSAGRVEEGARREQALGSGAVIAPPSESEAQGDLKTWLLAGTIGGLAARGPHPPTGESKRAGGGAGAMRPVIQLLADNQIRFCAPAVIDLGGIAKGFAVDRAVEALQRHDIAGGLVNAGGDLRAFGPHPHAVDVRDPRGPERMLLRVTLANAALASTAGRFDPARGRHTLACTVIDPATTMPAQSVSGATVCAPTCVMADALTKVVMIAGEDAGTVLQHYGADALFVCLDGDAHVTANWKHEVHLAA